MAVVERSPGGSSLIDVLDRVLDKGIIIDAWVRISLVGIDLITVEARVVVASIDTYLRYGCRRHRYGDDPVAADPRALAAPHAGARRPPHGDGEGRARDARADAR